MECRDLIVYDKVEHMQLEATLQKINNQGGQIFKEDHQVLADCVCETKSCHDHKSDTVLTKLWNYEGSNPEYIPGPINYMGDMLPIKDMRPNVVKAEILTKLSGRYQDTFNSELYHTTYSIQNKMLLVKQKQ